MHSRKATRTSSKPGPKPKARSSSTSNRGPGRPAKVGRPAKTASTASSQSRATTASRHTPGRPRKYETGSNMSSKTTNNASTSKTTSNNTNSQHTPGRPRNSTTSNSTNSQHTPGRPRNSTTSNNSTNSQHTPGRPRNSTTSSTSKSTSNSSVMNSTSGITFTATISPSMLNALSSGRNGRNFSTMMQHGRSTTIYPHDNAEAAEMAKTNKYNIESKFLEFAPFNTHDPKPIVPTAYNSEVNDPRDLKEHIKHLTKNNSSMATNTTNLTPVSATRLTSNKTVRGVVTDDLHTPTGSCSVVYGDCVGSDKQIVNEINPSKHNLKSLADRAEGVVGISPTQQYCSPIYQDCVNLEPETIFGHKTATTTSSSTPQARSSSNKNYQGSRFHSQRFFSTRRVSTGSTGNIDFVMVDTPQVTSSTVATERSNDYLRRLRDQRKKDVERSDATLSTSATSSRLNTTRGRAYSALANNNKISQDFTENISGIKA